MVIWGEKKAVTPIEEIKRVPKKKKGSKGSDWNNSYIQGLPSQNKTSTKDNEFIGLSGKVTSEIPQNGFGKYTFMMGVTYVDNSFEISNYDITRKEFINTCNLISFIIEE